MTSFYRRASLTIHHLHIYILLCRDSWLLGLVLMRLVHQTNRRRNRHQLGLRLWSTNIQEASRDGGMLRFGSTKLWTSVKNRTQTSQESCYATSLGPRLVVLLNNGYEKETNGQKSKTRVPIENEWNCQTSGRVNMGGKNKIVRLKVLGLEAIKNPTECPSSRQIATRSSPMSCRFNL